MISEKLLNKIFIYFILLLVTLPLLVFFIVVRVNKLENAIYRKREEKKEETLEIVSKALYLEPNKFDVSIDSIKHEIEVAIVEKRPDAQEKEETFEQEQTGPAYEGTAEDDKLLKNLTLEKIVLLLEKISLPEGYKREMVIDGNNIYGYLETHKEYLGQIIKERKLYRLKESIPDGTYLAKDLIPRILISYNRVVLTELIRKLTPEEIKLENEEESKIYELNAGTPFKT